jgi:hypothetical protein
LKKVWVVAASILAIIAFNWLIGELGWFVHMKIGTIYYYWLIAILLGLVIAVFHKHILAIFGIGVK